MPYTGPHQNPCGYGQTVNTLVFDTPSIFETINVKEIMMTNNTNQNEQAKKQPTHILYINSYVDGKPRKVKVGAAWQHSKGNGFNIALNDMVAFENTPRDETPNT